MGKSNLMKSFALSCMRLRRYGFLIFDPHGEYYDGGEMGKKGLSRTAAKDGLVVFCSRKLDGPYTTLHVSSSEIEIDDLENLYEFSGAQVECLQTAQYRYRRLADGAPREGQRASSRTCRTSSRRAR